MIPLNHIYKALNSFHPRTDSQIWNKSLLSCHIQTGITKTGFEIDYVSAPSYKQIIEEYPSVPSTELIEVEAWELKKLSVLGQFGFVCSNVPLKKHMNKFIFDIILENNKLGYKYYATQIGQKYLSKFRKCTEESIKPEPEFELVP